MTPNSQIAIAANSTPSTRRSATVPPPTMPSGCRRSAGGAGSRSLWRRELRGRCGRGLQEDGERGLSVGAGAMRMVPMVVQFLDLRQYRHLRVLLVSTRPDG